MKKIRQLLRIITSIKLIIVFSLGTLQFSNLLFHWVLQYVRFNTILKNNIILGSYSWFVFWFIICILSVHQCTFGQHKTWIAIYKTYIKSCSHCNRFILYLSRCSQPLLNGRRVTLKAMCQTEYGGYLFTKIIQC